jgi:hypothetical protein
MLLTINPAQSAAHESLCSMRFGALVNSVELGRARKHIAHGALSSIGRPLGDPPASPVFPSRRFRARSSGEADARQSARLGLPRLPSGLEGGAAPAGPAINRYVLWGTCSTAL